MVIMPDSQGVGAARDPALKEAMDKGRRDIASAQAKLNTSLTTPIVDQVNTFVMTKMSKIYSGIRGF